MTKEELINDILSDFLWEVVGNKTEEVKNLPQMLKDISYLDDKEDIIAKTTECEIQTSDNFDIINSYEKNECIVIECEMDFIMHTFIEEENIWSITGVTKCEISIPGIEGYDWEIFKTDAEKDDLLSHKDIVNFINISFDWVECDCMSL